MYRTNYCEIDLSAIRHNVGVMRSKLQPGTKFLAVVKADAYGHGAVPVARASLEAGADMLAVAIPEEGIELRQAGIDAPILILGGAEPEAAEAICENGLTQVVFTEEMIRTLAMAGVRTGRTAKVHLGMDSGMSRIGVSHPEEAVQLARLADSLDGIELTGCFTHMATADEDLPDAPGATGRQMERFRVLREAVDAVHPGLLHHGANTASIFRWPQLHLDMGRGGIALYGCPPVPEATNLALAMRWVTRAVYVKTINPGDRVSYGGLFEAKVPTRVMTLPVGYADGYARLLSCRGEVLVHGVRCPILGRVCMDQIMVDVSAVPGAAVGDEAVLLGRQGEDIITPEEIAEKIGTISYEVLCSPSKRVPRTYINV